MLQQELISIVVEEAIDLYVQVDDKDVIKLRLYIFMNWNLIERVMMRVCYI